jgi:AcrR family transcriptional regulator
MAMLQARSVTKRAELLRIATDMFLEHGYDAVSVEAIVQRAGGTKTNVYKHFGGKAELFAAALEGLCRELVRSITQVSCDGLEVEDALRAYGRKFLQTVLGERALKQHRMIVAESVRFPDLGRRWIGAGPEAAYRSLAAYLAKQQARGKLRPGSPRRLAILFLDMLTFDLHQRSSVAGASPPKLQELRRIVDDAVQVFLYGAAQKPPKRASLGTGADVLADARKRMGDGRLRVTRKAA